MNTAAETWQRAKPVLVKIAVIFASVRISWAVAGYVYVLLHHIPIPFYPQFIGAALHQGWIPSLVISAVLAYPIIARKPWLVALAAGALVSYSVIGIFLHADLFAPSTPIHVVAGGWLSYAIEIVIGAIFPYLVLNVIKLQPPPLEGNA